MNYIIKSVYQWFDSSAINNDAAARNINWLRCMPYILIYVGALAAFFVGVSSTALYVCLASYCVSVFILTGFYHRFFSHRTFKTSRVMQFVIAVIGMCAAQRSPLWWAAHHRYHHKHSDHETDHHSPVRHGFWRSHLTWFLEDANFNMDATYIKDLTKYPELVFLNRFDMLPPIVYIALLYYFGGVQVMVWGFFVSTVLVHQVTFSINSLAHMFGSRKFATSDNSKNNWWLALLSFGEGWHNNHHHWPSSARQGFRKHEIDITYYILKLMEKVGLIWDLRVPPQDVLNYRAA